MSQNTKVWIWLGAGAVVAVVALLTIGPALGWFETEDVTQTFQGFLLLAVLGLGYFLPTVIALSRKHHNSGAIIALNLLLGWTVLGWIAALVWSFTEAEPKVTMVQQVPPTAQTQYQVGDVVNGYRFNGQEWKPLS